MKQGQKLPCKLWEPDSWRQERARERCEQGRTGRLVGDVPEPCSPSSTGSLCVPSEVPRVGSAGSLPPGSEAQVRAWERPCE